MLKKTFIILFLLLPLIGISQTSWNSEMYIVTIITDNYTKTSKIIKN